MSVLTHYYHPLTVGKKNFRNTSAKSLKQCFQRSNQATISDQQLKLHAEQALEINDTVNRHKYLWICHYRKHKCKSQDRESTKDTELTRELADTFRKCARYRFRGIACHLISTDLSNVGLILRNTDDLLQDGNKMSLAQKTNSIITLEAMKTKTELSKIFKEEIFRKFYAALNYKREENLLEEKVKLGLIATIWNLLRFLMYADHKVGII